MMEPFFKTTMVPLFPVRLYVAFGDTLEEANDMLPKQCDGAFSDEEVCDEQIGAIVNSSVTGRIAVLFTYESFGVWTITHESVHVAMAVMSNVRMGAMNPTNEEAYAYVAGWFARTAVTWYNEQVAKHQASQEKARKTKKTTKKGK